MKDLSFKELIVARKLNSQIQLLARCSWRAITFSVRDPDNVN